MGVEVDDTWEKVATIPLDDRVEFPAAPAHGYDAVTLHDDVARPGDGRAVSVDDVDVPNQQSVVPHPVLGLLVRLGVQWECENGRQERRSEGKKDQQARRDRSSHRTGLQEGNPSPDEAKG